MKQSNNTSNQENILKVEMQLAKQKIMHINITDTWNGTPNLEGFVLVE